MHSDNMLHILANIYNNFYRSCDADYRTDLPTANASRQRVT